VGHIKIVDQSTVMKRNGMKNIIPEEPSLAYKPVAIFLII